LPQLGFGSGENIVTASADIHTCAEFKESLCRGPTQAGAAAGNENAFVVEKILLEHEAPLVQA
jgi:hypothetical protein